MKKIFTIISLLMAVSMSNAFTQEIDLDNGLVAYYPFYGDADDESGNGNNCTVIGASLTADRFGNSAKAYKFQNTGNELRCDVGQILSCSKLSVCAWFYRSEEGTTNPRIVAVGPPSSHIQYYSMIIDRNSDSKLGFYCTDGSSAVTLSPYPSSKSSIDLGSWYHGIIVYDGTDVKFYINGVLDTTIAVTGYLQSFTNAVLQIGSSDDGLDEFRGVIDDIRIYNRPLTEEEVQALYNEPDPMGDCLVAYYPFNNGNAHDASGKNHDGSVNGATATADRFGNANSAFSFNGISDYIECNAIPVLDSVFTYCAWIKVTRPAGADLNNNFGCFGTIGGGVATWDWAYNVTSQILWVFDKTNVEKGYHIVIDTNWVFVVVRYNGTTRSIYINGVPFGSPQSIATPITSLPTDVLRIGRHTNNAQQFMGSIDDVRLYCRALSESEIDDLYHEGDWPHVGMQSFDGKDFNVSIFPNPTNGKVFISSNAELRMNVYNLVGQKVFTGNTSEVQSVLLPNTGVYLFELTSGENTICKKVIVQ